MANRINLNDLVYPLFVKRGKGIREGIASMPGVYRFSQDELVKKVVKIKNLGIGKILLFGIEDEKDEWGRSAYKEGNITGEAVKLLKRHVTGVTIITDVCLCAYTSHGHCGIVKSKNPVSIDSGLTLSALVKIAVMHAKAGADYVAPSAMAKGQVAALRHALDEAGYRHTKIMGYSAKFASGFYGPFREAAGSAPKFGNRKTYQLNYLDREKALKAIGDDISEGADVVMVKPALGYLDIIREAQNRFDYPLTAYNVSGEYAMVKAGAQSGYWNEKEIVFEIISSIKRAGADIVITYHAADIARWLSEENRSDGTKAKTKKNTVTV